MWKITIIIWKISQIRKFLWYAEKYKKYQLEEILWSFEIQLWLERLLYSLSDLVISLAEACNAYLKLSKWTSYRESLRILSEKLNLSQDFIDEFINLSWFRNRLAHDYAEIDYEILYNILHKDLDNINVFIIEVERTIEK